MSKPFVAVTAATGAFFVYVGMLVPLLPRFIEDDLGAGELGVGLSLSTFAFGPRAVIAYLRSLLAFRPIHYLGHNPAGSWVIYLLVVLGLLTGIAGYATYNDIGGEWMEDLHEGTANVMLTLVFIHVAGVLVSSVLHRENLVKAMVTGYKWRRRDSAAGEQWAPRGHGD